MANWSISPTDATINSSGVANFPRNTEIMISHIR